MAVKVEAYIDLELSLQKLFDPRWRKIQNRVVPQITKAIEAHDMQEVLAVVDTINTELLYSGQTKSINNLLKTGMVFGGTLINGNTVDLEVVSNKDALELVPIATEQLKIQLDQAMITVRKRFLQLATKLDERLTYEENFAAEQALSKTADGAVAVQKINPINLPNALNSGASNIGRGMINVASSLQMSRMANYGFLAEADARGVTQYTVNEQLDSRICPVCRRMHGKTFEVPSALAKLDTQIRITDPSDLKLLAPFPKQSKAGLAELDSMSSEQLRAKGFDTPPYHPHCRGLLKAVTKAPPRQAPTPVERINPNAPAQPFTSASDYYIAGDTAVTEAGVVDALGVAEQKAIRNFESLIEKVTPTTDRFRNAEGVWSDARKKIHKDIMKKIILGFDEKTGVLNRSNITKNGIHRAVVPKNETPTYTVLGGRGGSGKSWLTGKDGPVDGKKMMVLDSDAIKGFLPEYQGWNAWEVHEESSFLFGEITKVAKRLNMNVVHDMTLKSAKSAKQRVSEFANAGYNIEGYYMYLPRQEAATRAVARALGKTQRYVPLDVILSNTKNEQVFDSLRPLFSRWGMWDNFVPKGTPPKIVGTSF
jgi:predicted ABC-type ATPase